MRARLRRAATGGAAAGCLLIAGCSPLIAQNPSTPMKPVNAVRFADEPRLMLGGRDVVAYFKPGTASRGSSAQRSEHERVAFYFASAENRTLFDANPGAYLPAYHGFCALAMTRAVPEPANPDVWLLHQGRVFLFADVQARSTFAAQLDAHVEAADRQWRERVRGRNADWQRMQRWLEGDPVAGAPAVAPPASAAAGG